MQTYNLLTRSKETLWPSCYRVTLSEMGLEKHENRNTHLGFC